jgi:hypothetical protein
MPEIKNLGYGSLAIQLSEDKQITLGPRETKEIALDDLDSEGVQKSLRDGLAMLLTSEEQPAKKSKPKPNSN